MSSYYLPHYVGPALPPLLLLYAASFALLLKLKRGPQVGRAAASVIVLALAGLYSWRIFAHTPLERGSQNAGYWTRQRQAMAKHLDSLPGRDVVFVRYAPNYKSQNEWVQNGANLSTTSVLWVHDLGDEANAALLLYEANRRPWLVTVHGVPDAPVLTPYESFASPLVASRSSTQLLRARPPAKRR
jgi:hypothetical protein